MTQSVKASVVLLIIVLAAILLRAAVIVAGSSSLRDDPDSYARLAVNWAEFGVYGFEADGGIRKTAFRPPLYPWLLSWTVQQSEVPWSGVGVLHLVLGLVSVALTYSIAKTLAVPHAWLPAIAVACDPILLRASQLVMTETLAACLALIVWRLWLLLLARRNAASLCMTSSNPVRWRILVTSFALGLAFGLAILARPTAAPWALLCVPALLVTWDTQRRGRVAVTGVVALGLLCCVVPWTVRNYEVFGKPIWATTHGGYTLLLANNPSLYEHFRRNGPSRGWDAEPFHQAWAARSLAASSTAPSNQPTQEEFWYVDRPQASYSRASFSEVSDDELAYASAKSCILRSPGKFVLSMLYRVEWFWALWPYTPNFSWSSVVIGGWYGIWFALALWGTCSKKVLESWRLWLPALLLLISLTSVHAIYWSNMRMRGPLMSTIYIVAAVRLNTRNPE